MLRTFTQHDLRPCECLDGWWDFTTAADRTDRRKLPDDYARIIHVPGVWEQQPGLENYRGKAWMRTEVLGGGDTAMRLLFGGVSHTADVHVDGRHVGHHYDAFTPFAVVVPGLDEETHELIVEVDNSFGEHSSLHLPNDYYTYGGITRPTQVQYVPAGYVEKLFATPIRKGGRWRLDLRVRLANWSNKDVRRRVQIAFEDRLTDLGEAEIPAGGTVEVHGVLKPRDVEAWTPDDPALYPVQAVLLDGDEPVDDLVDRVGFREVKVRGKKLLLNGHVIRLRGYNRHEDHPQFGCAIPPAAMVHDLELLRDLGCNFIRTCHYPNDMRMLDLCDELGMCVWEESHARAVKFDHPRFREQIAASTTEMIEWHGNHPCILMWGCLNECDSVSPAGRTEHERVIGLIRSLDDSRPVTFASNKSENDICLDLVDIVSWNRYVGWYGGEPAEVEADLKRMLKWLHSDASGARGKPVILSEFGAGAIPGWRNPNAAKWTEEYQARLLDEQLRVYLGHPSVVGAAVWQFSDCRITQEGGMFKGRPRTMNNKGTVDEHRRPKLAYGTVRHRMHESSDEWDT